MRGMEKKRIDVAVGVLIKAQKVLVGQRLVQDRYYQKWEFPGGKLDAGERPIDALSRELHEELGVQVCSARPLITLKHDYPDRLVRLFVFLIDEFSGEPKGMEGQAVKWVYPAECQQLDFLAANTAIVNAIELPAFHIISNIKLYGLKHSLATLKYYQKKSADRFALHLREPDLSLSECQEYLGMFREVANSALVFLNDDPDKAFELGFDGVHLNRKRSQQYDSRQQLPKFWVGASCHDLMELKHAQEIADFAFISPVGQTSSHPKIEPLGWPVFAELVKSAKLPCYALGGLGEHDINQAYLHGGQGIAAISNVWERQFS